MTAEVVEPPRARPLRAPFPWYGGKSRAAELIWPRFGAPRSYVEPFAGSLAVLLRRPDPEPGLIETVNDRDCYLANAWRALAADPDQVAEWADWPVSEADLRARHRWLVKQADFRARMLEDPDFYDVKIAGWWLWGVSCWIGDGWCSSKAAADGTSEKRPRLWKGGEGVNRLELSRAPEEWAVRPHLSSAGMGVQRTTIDQVDGLRAWFRDLRFRLRRVRVLCGDWKRAVGPALTTSWAAEVGVLLDPPYNQGMRKRTLYSQDTPGLSRDVREWAIEAGKDRRMRIALCGLEGEHVMPDDWEKVSWKAASETRNAANERIWFSPGCLKVRPTASQLALI